MARHRRPLVVGQLELQVVRGHDWISGDGVSPYWAWLMARFEWARDHPDDFSFGDVLDTLRAHAAYKRGLLP